MRILNQNKNTLINFENIEYINIVQSIYLIEQQLNQYKILAYTKSYRKTYGTITLGKYNTYEKALEIINEIAIYNKELYIMPKE